MSTQRKVHIISGFPGTGKSTAAKLLPGIVIDLESSDFHWIDPKAEVKKLHPAWPANYISAIRALAFETDGLKNYKDLLYVLISGHREVLNQLDELGISYAVSYPALDAKEEYISRYVGRGNTPDFIKKLDANFEKFIADLQSHKKFEIPLGEGEYLFDKLNDHTFEIPED